MILKGTETTEYLIDLLVDFDEMTFAPYTTCPKPEEYAVEWKQKLIYAIGKICKETVREFATTLKSKLDEQKHFYEVAEIFHRDISLMALGAAYKYLNETAKQFRVEVE